MAPTRASGPSSVNPDRRTPAERGTSGAGDGAVARRAVVAGVAVHACVPMHLGRLRGLVRLVTLPVQDEVPEGVHQTGCLQVLLAVRLDRVDRVGETRRVLDGRELTLHGCELPLTVRRFMDGGCAAATAGVRSVALLILPGCHGGL